MNIEITIREIYQLMFCVYSLGLLTVLVGYMLIRIWHDARENRRRREQFRIHRRTPYGIRA